MKLWSWITSLLCDHVTMRLAPVGAASVSAQGEVAMTIEITCQTCGYLNHRPLDVTVALREGVNG